MFELRTPTRGAMMRRAVAIALVILAGCSGAYRGGNIQRSLGNASAQDAMTRVTRVLNLYQFEIERQESTPQQLTVQTRWKRRAPFTDEALEGISAAETRVTITGRFRIETVQGALYAIDLELENRVQRMDAGDWIDNAATRQYRTYADSLVKTLQRELSLGVRAFQP